MPDFPKMDHNISEERFDKRMNTRSCPNSGNTSPTRNKKLNQEKKDAYTNEYSANEATRPMDQGSKTDAKFANKTKPQKEKKDAYTNEYSANEATRPMDQGSKTDVKFANKTKPQKLSPPNQNISDAFSRQSPKGSRMPSNSEPATSLVTGVSKGMSNHTKNNSQGGMPGSGTSSRSDSLESTSSNIRPHTGGDVRWDAVNMVLKSGPLNLSHFRLLKRIGYGDIGSVYLVELKGTDAHFAMKVMDKAALISRNKLLRSQTEREILGLLDHPFLPTLYSYFETDKFYCLVMEYCSGGDLHSLRQKQPNKCFSEEAARFYASEVLLALEYLHMLGIVYRDLKPENLLVRDEGHIMLSDFDLSLRCSVSPTLVKSSSTHAANGSGSDSGGIFNDDQAVQGAAQTSSSFFPRILPKKNRKAKSDFGLLANGNRLPELMAEPTNVRSMSFVGTHEYLAPEIIKGEGHGSAVDWWTFGIFLYELLHGATPFKGSGYKATLFNVVGQPLRFPDNPQTSQVAKDLIRGLLIKEPQKRIAYKRGATEIKQHPFFEGVNWALVRSAMPPHIPDVIDFSKYARKETGPPPVDKKLPDVTGDKKSKNSTDNSYVDFEYF